MEDREFSEDNFEEKEIRKISESVVPEEYRRKSAQPIETEVPRENECSSDDVEREQFEEVVKIRSRRSSERSMEAKDHKISEEFYAKSDYSTGARSRKQSEKLIEINDFDASEPMFGVQDDKQTFEKDVNERRASASSSGMKDRRSSSKKVDLMCQDSSDYENEMLPEPDINYEVRRLSEKSSGIDNRKSFEQNLKKDDDYSPEASMVNIDRKQSGFIVGEKDDEQPSTGLETEDRRASSLSIEKVFLLYRIIPFPQMNLMNHQ